MRRYGVIWPRYDVGDRVDGYGEVDYRGGVVYEIIYGPGPSLWQYRVQWDKNSSCHVYRGWELRPEA